MAVARMTFSVSPDLRKRVMTCRDVNWSAVVQQALEHRLRTQAVIRKVERSTSGRRLSPRQIRRIIEKALNEDWSKVEWGMDEATTKRLWDTEKDKVWNRM